ncbi:argininosuccinate synthase [candidate division KSB1 bacterium]|nr:argininosuccinate synthase [candidate division KSB1 bacterium]
MISKVQKVVLAYSGGLDTSIIIPWLKENYGCEVICYTGNVGQDNELEGLEEKAIASGASKIYIEDLREEFIEDYIFPTIKAGAIYEGRYLLGSALSRPIIAKHMVQIAEKENADALSHGCTGKGNDQVRFELTFKAMNPKLRVIAPWREWDIRSREQAIAYAEKYNIPLTVSKEKIYSNDANLWHRSSEGGVLEDPWAEPPDNVFEVVILPENAPDTAEFIEIEFEKGIPIGLNGKRLSPLDFMLQLNTTASRHGIGVVDMVENRLVGIKSRGVYETPGGTLLYQAHREIESLVLDADTMHFKESIAPRYAELVYYGKWFTPLRLALDGFVEQTQKHVTGTARLKLYKGNAIAVGRKSPFSLYREDYATFGEDDVYDQKDAEGFINCFGLPLKVRAMLKLNGTGASDYEKPDYSKFKRD